MSKRHSKIAGLIHRQLASLMKKKVNDPRLSKIVITAVSVSSDLGYANIYYTLPENVDIDAVMASLTKAEGFIRCQLALSVGLRSTPCLRFLYDRSIQQANRLLSLMKDANSELA